MNKIKENLNLSNDHQLINTCTNMGFLYMEVSFKTWMP